jgi:hypothetical protein
VSTPERVEKGETRARKGRLVQLNSEPSESTFLPDSPLLFVLPNLHCFTSIPLVVANRRMHLSFPRSSNGRLKPKLTASSEQEDELSEFRPRVHAALQTQLLLAKGQRMDLCTERYDRGFEDAHSMVVDLFL